MTSKENKNRTYPDSEEDSPDHLLTVAEYEVFLLENQRIRLLKQEQDDDHEQEAEAKIVSMYLQNSKDRRERREERAGKHIQLDEAGLLAAQKMNQGDTVRIPRKPGSASKRTSPSSGAATMARKCSKSAASPASRATSDRKLDAAAAAAVERQAGVESPTTSTRSHQSGKDATPKKKKAPSSATSTPSKKAIRAQLREKAKADMADDKAKVEANKAKKATPNAK